MSAAMPMPTLEPEHPEPQQRLLPFAEREYIDARRARHILGVSYRTLRRMAHSGLIEWLDYHKPSWRRIRYKSVVDFCDRVRMQHKIADRRPQLSSPYLRHKDEDLLPFPLSDSASASEALAALGLANTETLVRMVEEGAFEAYQFVPQAPWRVSRSSLQSFIEKSKAPGDSPHRYKVPSISSHF